MELRDHYDKPIFNLDELLHLSTDPHIEGRFIFFMKRLSPAFVDLLKANEPRALLILELWCALLSRIDQWWSVKGARIECGRICEHLWTMHDDRFAESVAFLISCCGPTGAE